MMEFGFATIGSIAVICFVFAQLLKLIPKVKDTDGLLPGIVFVIGAALGVVGNQTGLVGLAELDIMSAIATGIASAAAASGVFSWYKNIKDGFQL